MKTINTENMMIIQILIDKKERAAFEDAVKYWEDDIEIISEQASSSDTDYFVTISFKNTLILWHLGRSFERRCLIK